MYTMSKATSVFTGQLSLHICQNCEVKRQNPDFREQESSHIPDRQNKATKTYS